jgi:hypothetical protein
MVRAAMTNDTAELARPRYQAIVPRRPGTPVATRAHGPSGWR